MWIARIRPSCSALSSLNSFIASSRHSVWPTETTSPTSTNAGLPETMSGRRRRPWATRPGSRLRSRRRERAAPRRPRRPQSAWPTADLQLVGPAHRNPHSVVLDLDLADTGLLDDLDELANRSPRVSSTSPCSSDASRAAAGGSSGAALRPPRRTCEEDEVLFARGEPSDASRTSSALGGSSSTAGTLPATRSTAATTDASIGAGVSRSLHRPASGTPRAPCRTGGPTGC